MKRLFIFVAFSIIASASLANDSIPVLLYHSRNVGPTCSADDTDVLAFERDVAALREAGYVIRPLIEVDRKSTRLNSSHIQKSRMPSSA